MKNKMKTFSFQTWLVFTIVVVGFLVRFLGLGSAPGGINQDEAMTGYEAYSLLHYGVDSWGYHFPVYFISWGSGMNVLASYLTIPFMALFGNHLWVLRLPQAIIACVSMVAFYELLKKLLNNKLAVIGLFMIAICPWHIMMSRWGLESNLAPGLLIIAIYFSVLAFDNAKYLILMFAAYGIALYSYAPFWLIVPFLILLQVGYALLMEKIKLNRYFFMGVVLFLVLACPLFVYLLVNNGVCEEFASGFLSIPRMLYYRGNEINFDNIPGRLYNLFRMLTTQNDGLLWNSTEEFGLYYKFSTPFIVVGIYGMGRQILLHVKEKKFSPEMYMLIPGFLALCLGGIMDVNVNRINSIHFSMVLLVSYGIYIVGRWFGENVKKTVLVAYLLSFVFFVCFYFSVYNDRFSDYYIAGARDAIETAMQHEGDIYVTDRLKYSVVMYYSEIPQEEFRNTVQYSNYPAPYLNAISFGRFRMGYDTDNLDNRGIYVIPSSETDCFLEAGFEVEQYDYCALAYLH